MSKRIDGVAFAYVEAEQQCDDCGKIAELRPYGPGGAVICFECAMKDETATSARMGKVLFGIDPATKDTTP